jgi:hypothetical protein
VPFLTRDKAGQLVKMRATAWTEFQKHWRFLYDSLEGGDRYRYADYFRGPFEPWVDPLYAFGWDQTTGEGFPFSYGMIVQRNLVPHLSEKSVEGRDLYTLRLNRTPVPALVEFVVTRYLSKVFARQITRRGPAELETWWGDVDGKGTPISQWFRKEVGPLLLTLGQIDLVFGPPEADPDARAKAESKADVRALGLDGCVAGFILPENMVWYRLDRAGRYLECLVHERDDRGNSVWRHWTDTDSNAYTPEGDPVPEKSFQHGAGCVPIVRVFDERLLRTRHVGKSRVKLVAELQKNVYNRQSELVLNDVVQCHALLQGPDDFFQSDAKIETGPGGALPKKKSVGTGGSSYEGWEFIDPPKSGAAECRTHIQDDLDATMQHAGLLKPAGMTDGKTVAQSGLSKSFDAREGNDLLAEVSQTLADAERAAACMALRVLTGSEADEDLVEISYPREYDLFSASDLSQILMDVQSIAGSIGLLPETEGEVLKRLISVLLPGLAEDRLGELHEEIDRTAATRSAAMSASVGGGGLGQDGANPQPGTGQNGTQDPSISLPPDSAQAISALSSILAPDLA